MVALKKYNFQGKEVGQVQIEEAFLDLQANGQMIKDYIVALRANARQWSANTKGRSEINHSNRKPWRQKGTGNARQGTFAAPQFRGGGVVFGPKPKFDQHVRINRKERRLAICSLLMDKLREERIFFVEEGFFTQSLQTPKTKEVVQFLKQHSLTGRRLLFVAESASAADYSTFKKSIRNLSRCYFALAANVNGYDLLAAHHLVLTEKAFMEIVKLLDPAVASLSICASKEKA